MLVYWLSVACYTIGRDQTTYRMRTRRPLKPHRMITYLLEKSHERHDRIHVDDKDSETGNAIKAEAQKQLLVDY